MTEADKHEFMLTMAGLAVAFQAEMDEVGFEGYWIALGDLDLEAIRAATTTVARTCKFMPRAAEIRDVVVAAIEANSRAERIALNNQRRAQTIAYGIWREAEREQWTQEYLEAELSRVGKSLGLVLPPPPLSIRSMLPSAPLPQRRSPAGVPQAKRTGDGPQRLTYQTE